MHIIKTHGAHPAMLGAFCRAGIEKSPLRYAAWIFLSKP